METKYPEKIKVKGTTRWAKILADPVLHRKEREKNRIATAKYRKARRGEINYRSRIARRQQRKLLTQLRKTDPEKWAVIDQKNIEYRKRYYEKNKKTLRDKAKIYYRKMRFQNIASWRESHRIMNLKYRRANVEKLKAYHKARHLKLRQAAIEAYGKKCACVGCPEKMVEFLCIDHKNGKGNEHRRKLFGTNYACGKRFYEWLKREGYPKGFQSLCWNCNSAKHIYGICPHQKPK